MGGPGSGPKPGAKPTRTTRHGTGAGWGGPAKGRGNAGVSGKRSVDFQPGNTAAKAPETQEMKDRQDLRAMTKAQRKEEYITALHDLGNDPAVNPAVRVSAIVHVMDRDIGKPGSEDEGASTGTTIVVRGGLKSE